MIVQEAGSKADGQGEWNGKMYVWGGGRRPGTRVRRGGPDYIAFAAVKLTNGGRILSAAFGRP